MRVHTLLAAALLLVASVARAAAPETVSFGSTEGFTLTADLWPAANAAAPVAILLHQFDRDRRSFVKLVPALQEQGFAVLALDQRGQGDSKRQKTPSGERSVDVRTLPQDQISAFVKAGPGDVAAALAFLASRGIATDRVALVGASYGCSVALLATGSEPRVRALALLSPGADYFGVPVLPAAQRFPGAMIAVAAEDDPVKSSPGGTRALAEAHAGPEELLMFPAGGHGTALLDTHPGLAKTVAAFLADALAKP